MAFTWHLLVSFRLALFMFHMFHALVRREVPTNAGIVYGSSFRRRARPSAVEFEAIHGMIRGSGFEKDFATTKPQEWDREGMFFDDEH